MVVYLVAYAATAVVFFAVDFFWLGIVARSFYRDRLGHLMADDVNFAPAAAFYLVYVVGVVVFCVVPALADESWSKALLLGLLLGLVAYGTYDMTNLATLRDWPVAVAVVDMVWGGLLTGLSATAGYWLARSVA